MPLAACRLLRRHLRRWLPKRRWLRRLIVGSVILIAVALAGMYGIARWYIWSERNQPYELGASFIPDYAEFLGLNPEATLNALITQLHIRNFRLVSYWSDIEPTPGQYNFSELDSEFAQIAAAHGTVSLSIGLRQPRWPECHMPDWGSERADSRVERAAQPIYDGGGESLQKQSGARKATSSKTSTSTKSSAPAPITIAAGW